MKTHRVKSARCTVAFALLVLLFPAMCTNCSSSDKQKAGPFTISVVSMKWAEIPFGSPIRIGGRETRMPRDFVMLQVAVQVQNGADTEKELPLLFFIHDSQDKELTSLRRCSKGYLKQYADISLKMPPASSKMLYLQGELLPLKELQKKASLKIVHSSFKLGWDAPPLPKHAEFYCEKYRSKDLACRLLGQKWVGVPAGTRVMARGMPAMIKDDVAGIEATIRLLKPKGRRSIKITLQPGKAMVFVFESSMKGYAELKKREPLHLEEPSYRWFVPLEEIPPWEKIEKL
ncbi:MAG TPA: hypothetical protein ENG73_07820 [Desulfobacterales bacterium]|nr:hypothetical protein [Desulfobacterales bacterium]